MEKPKLRENLQVVLIEHDAEEDMAALVDPTGFVEGELVFPPAVLFILSMLDGTNSVRDIQHAWARQFGDILPADRIEEVVAALDKHMYLDSSRFHEHVRQIKDEYADAPYRTSLLAGQAYPDDPVALRQMLDGFFTAEDGPGRSEPGESAQILKGLIAPHIDLHAGGKTYAHAYKALAEADAPETFIVLGTDHFGPHRFTATRKGYQTPFGPIECAGDVLETLIGKLDFPIVEDEHLHAREHSIDFQAVWLKYLFPDRPIRIVPIICGAFAEAVYEERGMEDLGDVRAFCKALRDTVTESERPICLLAAADLSHVGMRFGKQEPLTQADIEALSERDQVMMEKIVEMDAEGMADMIIGEGDRRNVCGFPPIYVMLKALEATRGEGLDYGISYEEDTSSCVTFAAVAYY